eukprot:gene9277-10242_t
MLANQDGDANLKDSCIKYTESYPLAKFALWAKEQLFLLLMKACVSINRQKPPNELQLQPSNSSTISSISQSTFEFQLPQPTSSTASIHSQRHTIENESVFKPLSISTNGSISFQAKSDEKETEIVAKQSSACGGDQFFNDLASIRSSFSSTANREDEFGEGNEAQKANRAEASIDNSLVAAISSSSVDSNVPHYTNLWGLVEHALWRCF